MKTTGKLIIFIFTFLALAASDNAESPRDELKQMVEQLQKSPGDNALREKIIKLAISIKPAPVIRKFMFPDSVLASTGVQLSFDFRETLNKSVFVAPAKAGA